MGQPAQKILDAGPARTLGHELPEPKRSRRIGRISRKVKPWLLSDRGEIEEFLGASQNIHIFKGRAKMLKRISRMLDRGFADKHTGHNLIHALMRNLLQMDEMQLARVRLSIRAELQVLETPGARTIPSLIRECMFRGSKLMHVLPIKPIYWTEEKECWKVSLEVKLETPEEARRRGCLATLKAAAAVLLAAAGLGTAAYFSGYPPLQRFVFPSQKAEFMSLLAECASPVGWSSRDNRDGALPEEWAKERAKLLCAEAGYRQVHK